MKIKSYLTSFLALILTVAVLVTGTAPVTAAPAVAQRTVTIDQSIFAQQDAGQGHTYLSRISWLDKQKVMIQIGLTTYLIRKVVGDIIETKIKKSLDKIFKEFKSFSFRGPYKNKSADNYTIFEIKSDKNKELLRVDLAVRKKTDKNWYMDFHFHVYPDMDDHHSIIDYKYGKDKPSVAKWFSF